MTDNTQFYAELNARVDRGECYWCGTPDVPAGAWCPGCGKSCPRCGAEMTGCAWGPDSVCLDCHERAMLPPESFHDEHLAPLDAAGWVE